MVLFVSCFKENRSFMVVCVFVACLPFISDPYKVPMRKGEMEDEVSRPPTVKADDLRSMELPEEDEGGWAGHHEEVDYTKEVVFEDSSDEESPSKSNKTKSPRKADRKEDRKVCVYNLVPRHCSGKSNA